MIVQHFFAYRASFQYLLYRFSNAEEVTYKITDGGQTLTATTPSVPGITFVAKGKFKLNAAGDGFVDSDMTSFDFVENSTGLKISVLLPVLILYSELITAAGLGSGKFNPFNYSSFFNVLLPIVATLLILTGSEFNDVGNGFEKTDDEFDYLAGNDRHIAGGGDDKADGGDGRDTLDFSQASGTVRADLKAGTASHANGTVDHTNFENVKGSGGKDVVAGNNGRNVIDVGAGNDKVTARGGNDKVQGGAGNDVLNGGLGKDEINGGKGNDAIKGGAGDDKLNGGDGKDTVSGDDGNDNLAGGRGNDKVYGNKGNDFLDGGLGDDLLDGGRGNDIAFGGGGADLIVGRAGADVLRGGAGRDDIRGGDGNDKLDGGPGNDSLTGGPGADVFQFRASDGKQMDTVEDFTAGSDKVKLFGAKSVKVRTDGDDTILDYKNAEGSISKVLFPDQHLTSDEIFGL